MSYHCLRSSKIVRDTTCIQGSGGTLYSIARRLPSGQNRHREPGLSRLSSDTGKSADQPNRLLSSTLSDALKHSDLVAGLKCMPQGCGWEDVLECIANAKAVYSEKGEKSRLRQWTRSADATAGLLGSLSSMIPDEYGLSVLRQGMVLLFQVRVEKSEFSLL